MEGGKKARKKGFSCTYEGCGWSFISNYKLQRHIKSHTKAKPFKCEHCDNTFSYEYNLRVHEKSHAVKEPSFVDIHNAGFVCPYKRCTQQFKSRIELDRHCSVHQDGHKCYYPNCGKAFTRPCLLDQHLLIHNGIYPFVCDVKDCGKKFVRAQNLKHHKLSHSNDRNFKCDYTVKGKPCGKAFNSKEGLRIHQQVHGEKKYVCLFESCEKLFASAQSLQVHIAWHKKERMFACQHKGCKKTYLTASNLRAHARLHQGRRRKMTGKSFSKEDADKGTPGETVPKLGSVPKETFNPSDFINTSLGELNEVNTCVDPRVLSRDDILAATFGEIACNEYVKVPKRKSISKSGFIDFRVDIDSDASMVNEKLFEDDQFEEDIEDIQFQEEFPSNIYMPSVNNYRTFITGHDYEQSEYDTPARLHIAPPFPQDMDEVELTESSGLDVGHDVDYISEISMELSMGHLEIDGVNFCSSLLPTDHVYS